MLIRALPATLLALFGLALPATAAASLTFDHVSTQVTETSPSPDGILGPGDSFSIGETVLNSTIAPLASLQGTLTAGGGVSVIGGTSAFPVVAFGQQTTNITPFTAHIPSGTECGANLDFTLGLADGVNTTTVPFTVQTGAAGAPIAYTSGDVPLPIPNPGTVDSTLNVPDSGRVKGIRVRIGHITHPYDNDLTVTVIAPDGTRVELFRNVGGSGDDFSNAVFTTTGSNVGGASAPFTGTFGVDGLNGLIGHPMQGTWKLEVNDGSPADAGTLDGWGLDLTPATCAALPIASFVASPATPLPGATFTLDGSGSSDPVGTIDHYEWDLDGNGTYETDTGTTPTVTTSFASRGLKTVGLRVTDDNGLTDVATRQIAVSQLPVASFTATPSSPLSGVSTTLDASGSHDPDGTIVRYEWDLDGNGTFETDGGAAPTVSTPFAHPGDHIVHLRVTDDDGAQTVTTQTITVGNRAPSAHLTMPATSVQGATTTLDASSSFDPDGLIAQYEWDFDGDGTWDQTTTTPTVDHVYSSGGPVTAKVRVTDDFSPGASAIAVAGTTVTQAPVAALAPTPSTARPGQVVTLDASGSSDPDGGSLAKYEWDLDGDGTFELDTGTTDHTSTSWTALGAHVVHVRVTDADGATGTTSATVSVVNASPVVALSADHNPALTGQAVTFDASGSHDPDGSVVRYEWDLDGNGVYELDTGSTPLAARSYPNPTVLTVAVRVTDNDGATAVKTLTLGVAAADPGTPSSEPGPSLPATAPGATSNTSKPGGSTGGGGAGGGTSAGVRQSLTASLNGTPIQSARTAARKGLTVACAADRAALCSVVAEIQPALAKRLHLVAGRKAKAYRVGVAQAVAQRAAPGALVIKLPARLRTVLKHHAGVLVMVRGTAIDQTGRRVTLSRGVLLR